MELSLILAFPLISSIILGLGNKRFSYYFSSFLSSTLLFCSFILSACLFIKVAFAKNYAAHQIIIHWFSIGSEKIHWAIYADILTSVMFVVVTLVSTLVHVFSAGYMKDDPNYVRYMSYLSLFTFAMLLLVSADNVLQLFVGWEGVGLCSYLLIGFWYKKDSANNAAIKAFVVNRIGDFAFILGILSLIYFVGSVNFSVILDSAPILSNANVKIMEYTIPVIELIAMALFVGCMGKSAQIGLHVWLPDAMEGPTPVSALIHAATMVTAGIFLIVRLYPIFEHAPFVSNIILYVGAITCIFAASIAIAQDDIKKIIAYSTCSQLGYMFMACGAYSYSAGIFHLVTHAFFKASLFLLAGIVIHFTHVQDISKMGGLRKYIPITYLGFIVGSLAIMGIYPFAGYYSKDMILGSVYLSNNKIPFALGIGAAFFTAIYSMKIIIKVFHGEADDKKLMQSVIKFYGGTNFLMLVAVMPLMLLSVVAGFYCEEYVITMQGSGTMHLPAIIHYMPMGVAFVGIVVSIFIYGFGWDKSIASAFKWVYALLKNKYYIDEIYAQTFVRFTYLFSRLSECFDRAIDFCPNSLARISRLCGIFYGKCQSGYIFIYLFYLLCGLLAIMSWWLFIFYFR